MPEHLDANRDAACGAPGVLRDDDAARRSCRSRRSGFADEFFVSAVTGSTGAGRTPRDTTHHPLRQSNLFAYQALKHRHDPEVRALIKAATGRDVRLAFVPHSGPFARGIHATIFLHAKERMTASASQ